MVVEQIGTGGGQSTAVVAWGAPGDEELEVTFDGPPGVGTMVTVTVKREVEEEDP